MDIAIQIAILAAAGGIVVLVVLAIPILVDLQRIMKNWKKISNLLELSVLPFTWGASLIREIINKLLEGVKEKKEEEGSDTLKEG